MTENKDRVQEWIDEKSGLDQQIARHQIYVHPSKLDCYICLPWITRAQQLKNRIDLANNKPQGQ